MFGSRKTQSTSSTGNVTPPDREMSEPRTPPALSDGKPARQPIGFETIIGANCTFKGELGSTANVRIDGTVEGAVNVEGNIMVGESARISADVHGRNISIAGAIRGNVTGQKIQLLQTGRVWGDIHATALTTEEGAFIDGKIAMVGHPAVGESRDSKPDPVLAPPAETLLENNDAVEAEIVESTNFSTIVPTDNTAD